MNVRYIGIILIMFSGLLCTHNIKKRYTMRIEALEMFINNLDFIYTQISIYKIPVYDIVSELGNSSEKKLKEFYQCVLRYIGGGICFSFEKALSEVDMGLTKKDEKIILSFCETLGNTDYETQLKHIDAARNLLEGELKSVVKDKEKNQKSKCTLVMSGFIVVAVLLV